MQLPGGRHRILIALFGLVLLTLVGLSSSALAEPSGGHGGDPSEHFNWTDLGYKDKNILGGEPQPGVPDMDPPMILMFLNFAIVLVIIGWKVRPPVMNYLKGRHQSIKDALEEAAKHRAAAKAKLDEVEERMAEVEGEVDKMVSDIRASAEAEKKRIIAAAEAQAQSMKRDAEARISAEIARARAALDREVVVAAVAAADKLIREKASPDDHTNLIDSFIGDVEKQAQNATREGA